MAETQTELAGDLERMSQFELKKELPSCKVTKQLLIDLEAYILDKLSEVVGVTQANTRERYSVSIVDGVGEETMPSISEYAPSAFSDSTKVIRLRLWLFDTPKLTLDIDFARSRGDSKVSLTYKGNNAKTVAKGIYDDIASIVGPISNRNWMFHPPLPFDWFLSAMVGVPFIPFLYLAIDQKWYPLTLVALFWSVYVGFLGPGRWLKPYTTFDSRRSERLKGYTSLLWGLFITLVGGILTTLILGALDKF